MFKVYTADVDGLTEDQRSLGQTVARQITGGVELAHLLATQAGELDDRTAAMDQRRQIDLAVGMLMERFRCSPTEAFERLRRQSNDKNQKVRDVAAGLRRVDAAGDPGRRRSGRPTPAAVPGSPGPVGRSKRSRASSVPAAVAAGKTTVPASGMLISRKVGIDRPSTRERLPLHGRPPFGQPEQTPPLEAWTRSAPGTTSSRRTSPRSPAPRSAPPPAGSPRRR